MKSEVLVHSFISVLTFKRLDHCLPVLCFLLLFCFLQCLGRSVTLKSITLSLLASECLRASSTDSLDGVNTSEWYNRASDRIQRLEVRTHLCTLISKETQCALKLGKQSVGAGQEGQCH